MRTAKAGDHWRRVYERPYTLKLDSITFERVIGIGSGEMPFNGGITAICGANGVGKTTLLNTVLGALDITVAGNSFMSRLSNSELRASITVEGETQERTSRFGAGAEPIIDGLTAVQVTRIDPSAQSIKLTSLLSEAKNFDELLEGLSPADSDDKELRLLSYIVGKDYDSCQTYEIEDYNDEPVFPYFRVSSGGITYGSEEMGLGEMSLYLMYWHLKRTPSNSILLIEEPETYISPRSQSALLDAVAKFSMEKSVWVILTTHSPSIVSKIPLEHIRLLSRERGQVTIYPRPTQIQLNSIFRIPHQYLGTFLVEDRVASELLKAWLDRYDPDLLQWFEVVITGSEADTQAALKFPKLSQWFRAVGIFDGDAKARVTQAYNWPYAFLPGDVSPEALLRSTARGNADKIAQQLSRAAETISFILSELEGLDDHDWYEEFHRRLGISSEQLMSVLFSVWIEEGDNTSIANDAFEALLGHLRTE